MGHELSQQALELISRQAVPEGDQCFDIGWLREQNKIEGKVFGGEPEPIAQVDDIAIDGVAARLYRPRGDERDVFVWFHGGGWSRGDLDYHDSLARRIANRVGCAVLQADYRLSPEHSFPAALDDAWTAVRWAVERFANVAVGGESSGGNLAAVSALRARDEGMGIALQVLVYPVVDSRLDTPEVDAFVEAYSSLGPWEDFGAGMRAGMEMMWSLYVPDPSQRLDPEVAPIMAESLAGVAPAAVVLAEHDFMRLQIEGYVRRLEEAGVAVEVRTWDRQLHGFYGMLRLADAREAADWSADALGRAFSGAAAAPAGHDAR